MQEFSRDDSFLVGGVFLVGGLTAGAGEAAGLPSGLAGWERIAAVSAEAARWIWAAGVGGLGEAGVASVGSPGRVAWLAILGIW